MNPGLVVTDLHAHHGTAPVLRGVDLTVPNQTLGAILGPSGCGKTTLLRTIAGFHRPTAGRIELRHRLLDEPPRHHLPAQHRLVGYIPQDVALFPHLSVAANIGFGLPHRHRAPKVAELLELTDLGPYARRHPHQLSGGQQQRVALARALATGPDLLLLDEPFSALDASLRTRVRADVIDLLRATGTTAILVTHDALEALAFADTITVMADGRALQTATPEQLYAAPDSVAVARALGEANILDATIDANRAKTVLGILPLSAQSTVYAPALVLIRPEQITAGETSSTASTPAVVRRSTFQGSGHRLELDVKGSDRPVIAQVPVDARPSVPLGSTVHLTVEGTVQPLRA